MELYSLDARRPVIAMTALAAVAGLLLAGCSSSGGSAAATGNAAAKAKSGTSASSGQSTAAGKSASSVTSSGSLPFPTTTGDTWVYQDSNGSTSENKVKSVKQVKSGRQVTMDATFQDNGTTSHSHYAYVVEPDGKISLPFSQFGATGTAASFSVKLVSGGIYWPSAAELASGRKFHSTLKVEYTLAGKKQQVTTYITTSGGGTQSVTVPAGTYSATVVDAAESEKLDGTTVTTDIKDWLASGVGPVQSEILSGASGKVVSREELTSFVRG